QDDRRAPDPAPRPYYVPRPRHHAPSPVRACAPGDRLRAAGTRDLPGADHPREPHAGRAAEVAESGIDRIRLLAIPGARGDAEQARRRCGWRSAATTRTPAR